MVKVRASLLGLAMVSTMVTTSAFAVPFIWLVDENQKLGKVDVQTGAVSGVVSTGRTFTDIAFDGAGALWGITFTQLFQINPNTGASTLVGNLNAGENLNALVFGSDGTLWAAGSKLYTVNTSTGVATSKGNGGTTYSSAGDLAFVGSSLLLSTNANQLVSLSTVNGAATARGPFGVSQVYGLATPDNGVLYGTSGATVFSVNPATGTTSQFVNYSGQGLGIAYGTTFVGEATAIPEPSHAALLLAGLGVVALRLRRRSS